MFIFTLYSFYQRVIKEINNRMNDINKYGLSRYIPSYVKRSVRKKCGFGCVICGLAIAQYEHLEPCFSEAKEHNANNIVLLCGSCHDRITRKVWSKEKVKIAGVNPKCKDDGFAHDAFDIGYAMPEVVFGGSIWRNTPKIIEAMDKTILKIESPERYGGPYRLTGIFCDDQGKEIFRINRNEWQGSVSNWDIEATGPTLTIRRDNRIVALKLTVEPSNRIVINQINMVYRGAFIDGKENKNFVVRAPDGSTIAGRVLGNSCKCGVKISKNSVAFGVKCKSVQFI